MPDCAEFAGRWLTEYPRQKASTTTTYSTAVRAFARDFEGIALADVGRQRARAWARENRAYVGAVRAMYGDALNDELVARNPFSNLRLPQSRGRKDIETLIDVDLERIIGFAGVLRGPVIFAAYTGIRPGELFALEWGDVDEARGELRIERRVYAGKLDRPKNGEARTIVLPPPAADALPEPASGVVFRNERGKPWRTTKFNETWRLLRDQAGFPTMDFYDLRHHCATYLLNHGATPEAIAHQLGHSDNGALVLERYAHPAEDRLKAELRAVFAKRED